MTQPKTPRTALTTLLLCGALLTLTTLTGVVQFINQIPEQYTPELIVFFVLLIASPLFLGIVSILTPSYVIQRVRRVGYEEVRRETLQVRTYLLLASAATLTGLTLYQLDPKLQTIETHPAQQLVVASLSIVIALLALHITRSIAKKKPSKTRGRTVAKPKPLVEGPKEVAHPVGGLAWLESELWDLIQRFLHLTRKHPRTRRKYLCVVWYHNLVARLYQEGKLGPNQYVHDMRMVREILLHVVDRLEKRELGSPP
ncbi:MAG: hypothetical protein DRO11_08025, partial [Methanobacteriota archaeon]